MRVQLQSKGGGNIKTVDDWDLPFQTGINSIRDVYRNNSRTRSYDNVPFIIWLLVEFKFENWIRYFNELEGITSFHWIIYIYLQHCNKKQTYVPESCECQCNNVDEKKKCNESDKKLWNLDLCSCSCREVRQCSTGLYFDQNACRFELNE